MGLNTLIVIEKKNLFYDWNFMGNKNECKLIIWEKCGADHIYLFIYLAVAFVWLAYISYLHNFK